MRRGGNVCNSVPPCLEIFGSSIVPSEVHSGTKAIRMRAAMIGRKMRCQGRHFLNICDIPNSREQMAENCRPTNGPHQRARANDLQPDEKTDHPSPLQWLSAVGRTVRGCL